MLDWEQLVILNKKMSSPSILRLLKDTRILGIQLTIEALEDIISRIVVNHFNI